MTKSRRVRGQSTSSIGTANFRNSVQFVKFEGNRVSRGATGTRVYEPSASNFALASASAIIFSLISVSVGGTGRVFIHS